MKRTAASVILATSATALLLSGCAPRGEEISPHITAAIEEAKTNDDPHTGWVHVSTVLTELQNGDEYTTYTYMKCDGDASILLTYSPVGYAGNHTGTMITNSNSDECQDPPR